MTEGDWRPLLPPGDDTAAREIARQVLARDRRRLRILTAATILLWLFAAAGITTALTVLLTLHPEHIASNDANLERVHYSIVTKMTGMVALSVAILALAA